MAFFSASKVRAHQSSFINRSHLLSCYYFVRWVNKDLKESPTQGAFLKHFRLGHKNLPTTLVWFLNGLMWHGGLKPTHPWCAFVPTCEKVSWLCGSVMWWSDNKWSVWPPSCGIKQQQQRFITEGTLRWCTVACSFAKTVAHKDKCQPSWAISSCLENGTRNLHQSSSMCYPCPLITFWTCYQAVPVLFLGGRKGECLCGRTNWLFLRCTIQTVLWSQQNLTKCCLY